MKTYKEFITELSKGTLNKYLDKNDVERKKSIETGDYDKARKRMSGAGKAIDKVNQKINKQRQNL